MKKITLFLMVISFVFASSCKKDSADPTYTKSQIIGKWKQTSPASTAGTTDYLALTDDKLITSYSINGVETSANGVNYTFDGKVISYDSMLGTITYTIKSLSTTTLSVTMSWMGAVNVDYTYTKQ